jgi:hypothetical protein
MPRFFSFAVRSCLALACLGVASSAHAGWFWDWDRVAPFSANDTGGIIAWSPAIKPYYHQMAADHCARYNKVARITSVHAHYGDYIGFVCRWPRHYDPVKALYYGPVVRTLD